MTFFGFSYFYIDSDCVWWEMLGSSLPMYVTGGGNKNKKRVDCVYAEGIRNKRRAALKMSEREQSETGTDMQRQ